MSPSRRDGLVTPKHPLGIFPPADSRGTYKMCTCYGMAMPYSIGLVHHTSLETNLEAAVTPSLRIHPYYYGNCYLCKEEMAFPLLNASHLGMASSK